MTGADNDYQSMRGYQAFVCPNTKLFAHFHQRTYVITILPLSQNGGDRKACLSAWHGMPSAFRNTFSIPKPCQLCVQPDDVLHVLPLCADPQNSIPPVCPAQMPPKKKRGRRRSRGFGLALLEPVFSHGTAYRSRSVPSVIIE